MCILQYYCIIQKNRNIFLLIFKDAWKRRGQTRAAANQVRSALADLARAADLSSTDPDVFHQIGLVYHQVKDYKSALKEFQVAQSKGMSTAQLHNYIGMCEVKYGYHNDNQVLAFIIIIVMVIQGARG